MTLPLSVLRDLFAKGEVEGVCPSCGGGIYQHEAMVAICFSNECGWRETIDVLFAAVLAEIAAVLRPLIEERPDYIHTLCNEGCNGKSFADEVQASWDRAAALYEELTP